MDMLITELRAGYGAGTDVLKGISLEAKSGSIVGIIGANGAGKSTMLKSICGFLKPRNGDIRFDGRVVTGLPPDQLAVEKVGYLMEGHSVFASLTVEDNLRLGGWSFRSDRPRLKRAIERAFERAPVLRTKRLIRAGLLSGGQQRILELERLCMADPELIILDEPSLGLAPKLVGDIFNRINQLRSEGATVVIVDQSARHIAATADYIYVLKLGQIETHGVASDFRERIDAIVREFI
jgi:branched-chain amino acid transport system ATP-binding protein